MESICKNHFLQLLYRKIDGATLLSRNERNLNCVVTFQTHSILQRFMLRFDMLQLDCNDHLYVYDGAHAVGTHKVSVNVLMRTWFAIQHLLGKVQQIVPTPKPQRRTTLQTFPSSTPDCPFYKQFKKQLAQLITISV